MRIVLNLSLADLSLKKLFWSFSEGRESKMPLLESRLSAPGRILALTTQPNFSLAI